MWLHMGRAEWTGQRRAHQRVLQDACELAVPVRHMLSGCTAALPITATAAAYFCECVDDIGEGRERLIDLTAFNKGLTSCMSLVLALTATPGSSTKHTCQWYMLRNLGSSISCPSVPIAESVCAA